MLKHSCGIYRDACIVKMAPKKYCVRGFRIIKWEEKKIDDVKNKLLRFAVYNYITIDVVDTRLWKELLKKLSKV